MGRSLIKPLVFAALLASFSLVVGCAQMGGGGTHKAVPEAQHDAMFPGGHGDAGRVGNACYYAKDISSYFCSFDPDK